MFVKILRKPKRKNFKGVNNHNWKGGIFTYPNHYEMKKNRNNLIIIEDNGNYYLRAGCIFFNFLLKYKIKKIGEIKNDQT